jgi:hypothetical protein
LRRASANRNDHAAGRAGLRIAGAEDDAGDARVHDRAGAHRAGLQRHVERAVRQPVVAAALAGIAQRHHLGMGGRVVAADGLVEAAADDLAVENHHGAHRHLAASRRLAREVERRAHEIRVVHCRAITPHATRGDRSCLPAG